MLKLPFRILTRNKLFSLINISGLVLGFTVLLAAASYIIGEFSYDAHHSNASRIFRVTMDIDNNNYKMHWARLNVSYINALPREFSGVRELVRFQDFYERDIQVGEEVYRMPHAYTTDGQVFGVFDFELLRGNPERALTEPHSVVLTESAAYNFFGRTDVLNESIGLLDNAGVNKTEYRVTGIMKDIPQNSHMPVNMLFSFDSPDAREGWAYTYVLLNDPSDRQQVAGGMTEFVRKYAGDDVAGTVSFPLQNLRDIHVSGGLARELKPVNNRAQLVLFGGVALLVFLLTLINYINLNSAQSLQRKGEIGIRKVLGAGTGRIGLQFFRESLVLVALAAVISVVIYEAGQPFIRQFLPSTVSLTTMLAFLAVVTILTAVLASYYPSVVLNLQRYATGKKNAGFSARTLMVGMQMIICIAVVSAALISSRQFRFIAEKNLGFDKSQVMAVMRPAAPVKKHAEFVKDQLAKLPGVTAVSSVMEVPSREIRDAGPVYVTGRSMTEAEAPVMDVQVIDNTFIDLMGMELVAGTGFTAIPEVFQGTDDEVTSFVSAAPRQYIINETALEMLGWSPEDALGQLIHWEIGNIVLQDGPVVGVVKDYHQETLRNVIDPLVMIQEPVWTNHFLVRIAPDKTGEVLDAVKKFWDTTYPGYPLQTVFLDDLYGELYAADQRQLALMRMFSFFAITISFLGIFGLLAFSLKSREKEMAVRKVLGASVASITGLISRGFVVTTLAGAGIAIPITWVLMQRWLEGYAYRITIVPLYFLISMAVVIGVFLIVVMIQSRKLSSVNPAHILRSE